MTEQLPISEALTGMPTKRPDRKPRMTSRRVKIRWKTKETFDFIMNNFDGLISEGWIRPSARTLLYRLIEKDAQHWTKDAYSSLVCQLDKWKQEGVIPYGRFASDSGGAAFIPSTQEEIDRQIKLWEETEPMQLSRDGNLYALLVEHAGLVDTCKSLFEGKLSVISSAGQIRHEHLYEQLNELEARRRELNGMSITMIGFADYDSWGAKNEGFIIRAHKNWITRFFANINWIAYDLNSEQIEKAGLDPEEEYQFDGWLALYGLPNFKKDILRITRLK